MHKGDLPTVRRTERPVLSFLRKHNAKKIYHSPYKDDEQSRTYIRETTARSAKRQLQHQGIKRNKRKRKP